MSVKWQLTPITFPAGYNTTTSPAPTTLEWPLATAAEPHLRAQPVAQIDIASSATLQLRSVQKRPANETGRYAGEKDGPTDVLEGTRFGKQPFSGPPY